MTVRYGPPVQWEHLIVAIDAATDAPKLTM